MVILLHFAVKSCNFHENAQKDHCLPVGAKIYISWLSILW